MESVRPAFASAAVALAAAGLVVATPVAVQASGLVGPDIALTASAIDEAGSALVLPDPFGAMQDTLEFAQRQISDGFAYLGQGELGLGVGVLTAGFANAWAYAPLASLLTVIDAQVWQHPASIYLPDGYFLGLNTFDGLVARIDDIVARASEVISLGFEQLAAGEINHALANFAYGITNFMPDIPLQLMVGSTLIFEDMLGLDMLGL